MRNVKRNVLNIIVICFLFVLVGCGTDEQGSSEEGNDYPTKDITLYVPFSAGGTNDAAARIFGKYLSENLNETVLIQNKPGGGGLTQTLNLRTENNDGYHLQFGAEDPFTVQYALDQDLEYELDEYDFLAAPFSTPNQLVVHADSGYDDVDALIKAAKDGEELTYAHAGAGSINHFAGEATFSALGIDVQDVPFEGGGESLNALLGKDVDALLTGEGTILGQLDEGTIKVLANTTNVRSENLSDVPTLEELGYDVDINAFFFVFAPEGLPSDVSSKLTKAFEEMKNDEEFVEEIEGLGLTLEDARSEDEIKEYIEETREVFSNIDIE